MVNKKLRIINISAKARCGKDSSAKMIKEKLESNGYKVLITHYADWLKQLATQLYGTTLEHTTENRTIWQDLGHQARENNPDYWVNHVIEFTKVFGENYDFIIIPDCRYENEQCRWCNEGFDLTSLHISRPNFDNGLTEEQKSHPSEHGLDNFRFDYYIEAENLSDLEYKVDQFIDYVQLDMRMSQERNNIL